MNQQRGFAPILVMIITVAILAVGSGVVYYVAKEKTSIETADWKIYKNDQYSFQIKYPANLYFNSNHLTFKNGDPDTDYFSISTEDPYASFHTSAPPTVTISVFDAGGRSIKEIYEKGSQTTQFNFARDCRSIVFAKESAYNCTPPTGGPHPTYLLVLFIQNGYEFSIVDYMGGAISRKIISSFTFLQGESQQKRDTGTGGTGVDIANWKTYRNEQYEFEIKYPLLRKKKAV